MTKGKKKAADAAKKKPVSYQKQAVDITKEGSKPYLTPYATGYLLLTTPGRFLADCPVRNELENNSVELFVGLNPRNAQEAIICMLAVAISNASLDCVAQASLLDPGQFTLRDLNLRHGFKGAQLGAELIKTLNDLRCKRSEKVQVSSVNVEAGGQAIVGNVEAAAPKKAR